MWIVRTVDFRRASEDFDSANVHYQWFIEQGVEVVLEYDHTLKI